MLDIIAGDERTLLAGAAHTPVTTAFVIVRSARGTEELDEL